MKNLNTNKLKIKLLAALWHCLDKNNNVNKAIISCTLVFINVWNECVQFKVICQCIKPNIE